MVELKEYNFSDLYEMSSGLSSKKEQAGHGSPFVSFRTVFNNYFLPNELEDKMDTSLSEQEIYSVKADDILLTRTSETIDELGMSCVVLNDVQNATYSGFTKRLRPKVKGVVYSKYIGFYLRTKMFRKTMTNNAFMTLRASLNDEIFSYLKLYLPDYQTQVKIGDFLYSLNQKIALNNKTNTELENMGKTIYDYWFTQFDFPDKNGHPYKTSGGQMVYNETLKREIPAGWEVKSLSQICELQRGVTYGKDDEMSESDENVVQILRGNNISNNHIVYDSNTVYVSSDLVTKEQKIKKFDVVITMSSGSKEHVGKSAMFLFDSPHSYGAFCNKLTPLNESQFFVENFMHSYFFKIYINHVCIGTGINNLKGEHFSKVYFAYPADSVLKQFNEIMKPIYEKRSYMEQANEELTKLRDYLLPLLMNGQIEVK